MSERLDVIVFGATSVTAREVCRYLDSRAALDGFTWAAAGRDPVRLREALAGVDAEPDEYLLADVTDPASLTAMARRGRVVLNLVGPYARYAAPVVEACIETGTHYADLTGETVFMRRLADDLDAAARASGVKVVQPCGFESLPPDLSLGLALDAAAGRGLGAVTEVAVEVGASRMPARPRVSDMISGGTLQSLAQQVGEPDAADVYDPAVLVADPARAERVRALSPLLLRPRVEAGGAVLAPMIPAPTINPPVLHRSAELLGVAPFRYREGFRLTSGRVAMPFGAVAAGAVAGFGGALRALSRAPDRVRLPAARVLERVLPDAGYGPAPERIGDWAWTMTTTVRTESGAVVTVSVDADGHPGYLATARMLGEAGILLAGDATPERAGCLTPLAALGSGVTDSFTAAGLRFSVA